MMLAAGLLTVPGCGQDPAAVKPVETKSAVKPVDVPVKKTTPPRVAPADAQPNVAADTKPAVVAAPVKLRPQTANAWRPCELAVQPCAKRGKPCPADEQCMVTLARFIPEGTALDVLLKAPETRRWRYAADERLLEAPDWTFQHTSATAGFRSRKDGSQKLAVQFDAQGRLTTVGDQRFEYLPDGRTAGYSTRSKAGKWKQTVTYKWDPRQTYGVNWTYPDADEFCEPEPASVQLDAEGRVAREVYADCQINYSEFTLRYGYDAAGRPVTLDVECQPGDDASTWQLALKYECPEAASP